MKGFLLACAAVTLLVACGSKKEEVKAVNDTLGEGNHNIRFDDQENLVIDSRFENAATVTAAVQLYQLAYDDAHSSIIGDHEAGKGVANADGSFSLILPKQTVFGGFYMANPQNACVGTYTENLLQVAYHTVINYRVNGKAYVVMLTNQSPFNTSFTPGKRDYQFVYAPEETQLKADWTCHLGEPGSHVVTDAILKPGWNILEKTYQGVDATTNLAEFSVRRIRALPRDAKFYIKP